MIYNKVLVLSLVIFLSSCASVEIVNPGHPDYAAVNPNLIKHSKGTHGSIYHENYRLNLFETIKARRVGDILTVTLEESTDASKNSSTTSKKDESTDISNPTILGAPVKLNAVNNLAFNLNGKRSFSGNGESKQNNTLEGTITVQVYDVLPNNNLKIRGEKWIRLNQGKEYIRLRGIIRPEDIKPDNTISSYRIADAKIIYSGTGQLSDANKQGWLARFFNSGFWPF